MSNAKYIGLDVHQATTVAAVLDASGKLVMEAIVETKAATILDFLEGIRGELNVTLEEGTCAAWLHDLLESHVHRVVVCDPRKNALLKQGKQERQGRCPEAGRVATRRPAFSRLSPGDGRPCAAGSSAQLSNTDPGCDAG